MNKSQKMQFDILKEVDRLCRKYKIKYYLSSGTLLGAVRHKGYIPWDDDMDIEMLRDDYEKFKQIALKEMDKKYFWQDVYTDKHFGYVFAKIKINGTKYIEEMAVKNKAHNGIYIDIFPIDRFSGNQFDFKKIVFLRMLLLIKNKYIIKADTLFKKIELIGLKLINPFVTRNLLIKIINTIIKKNKKGKYLTNYSTVFFNKNIRENEWYKNTVELEFEGSKFMGPSGYDEILTFLYGNYMQLPPVEKRVTHSIVEIDYGDKK